MSTSEDQPSMIELIELSDLAWTIVNSVGEHEPIEQAWTSALPDDWAPAEGVDELRTRLGEITDLLRATGETALLEVVSAVIVYLADHRPRGTRLHLGGHWPRGASQGRKGDHPASVVGR